MIKFPGIKQNKYLLPVFLVGLFLLFRLAIMFSSEKLIWHGEEPFVGIVTKGIIEGWAIPPFDYQQTPYFGGAAFNAVMAVPSFLLFGPQFFSLRLTSILFHAGGLIALFLLLSRYFSIRAAVFASCFYIFSPPLLTARSFIFNGGHAETVIFDALILLAFLNLIYKNPSGRNYSILGFLSGFSLWYAYSNVISIINYTLVWFIKDRKFFLNKKYLIYWLSFAAGLTPWLIFNLSNNFEGLRFLRNEYPNLRMWHPKFFLDALWYLIFRHGYKIFIFNEGSPFGGHIFNVFYYLVFMVSFLFISFNTIRNILPDYTWSGERKNAFRADNSIKGLAIVAFPVIFAVIYALSGRLFYDSGVGIVDYRYFVIVLPFIFMTIALFLDKLFTARNYVFKFIGALLFVSLIFLGIIGNSNFIYSRNFSNNFLNSPAYSYKHVGAVAFLRYGHDIEKVKSMIGKVKDKFGMQEAYYGYAESLSIKFGGEKNLEKYIELSAKIDSQRLRKWFFWGIGEGIIETFYTSGSREFDDLKQIFLRCDNIGLGQTYKNYLYFGMLARLSFMRGHENRRFSTEELTRILNAKHGSLVYLYYGIIKGANICRTKFTGNYSDLCADIDWPQRKYCYMGIGAGVADFFSCDFHKAIDFVDKSDKETYEFLLQGMGLYLFKIRGFDKEAFEKKLPSGFERYRASFNKGADVFTELVDPNP